MAFRKDRPEGFAPQEQRVQAKGMIRYRRGIVDILDRPGLEAISCECYDAVRRMYDRLITP